MIKHEAYIDYHMLQTPNYFQHEIRDICVNPFSPGAQSQYMCKQYRSRREGSKWTVSSGSTLFDIMFFI